MDSSGEAALLTCSFDKVLGFATEGREVSLVACGDKGTRLMATKAGSDEQVRIYQMMLNLMHKTFYQLC